MNDRFEIIKNMKSSKYKFRDDYQKWGLELIHSLLEKINLDGWEEFENDTFEIVPYDWDGCNDCTCYMDKEIEDIPYSDKIDKLIEEFDNTHMHTIDCASHDTNFYHKPTGICIEWWKHVDGFKFINKKITFEDWEAIIEDCAKSVLGDKYEESKKETNNKNLDEYEKQLLKVSLKARMNAGYRALCDETLKSNHDSIREEIQTIREIADKLNLGKID